MLQPLLRTKTTIPPASPWQITRARLLEKMGEGTRRALTLIIAPAGYGKTTLAAAWARSCPFPVAWLSLQSQERAAERFLAYLILSIQSIYPHLGQTSLALMKGGISEGGLFALLNDLAEVEDHFAMILDDYHLVDSPEIAEIMRFLLINRPATFHLVLTTRAIPSFSLIRLRALDQMTEIDANDLRFSQAELSDFLENSIGMRLPPAHLTELDQFSEGWAVAVQLAALALARQPADWPIPAGREQIFDYLAEEVLRRETPEVHDFLRKTAFLDRFCVSLCEAMLGSVQGEARPENAAGLLAYVEHATLFLIPLDATGTWFRYHALFADFLQKQLSPDLVRSLYDAASQWFEQNGLLDEAIHYAISASNFGRAAGLLEEHYRHLLQRGEQTPLAKWLSALPSDLMEKHPRLWLAKGWASIISLNPTQAELCAQKAEALIPVGPTGDKLRGEANSLRILAGIFAGKVAAADEIPTAVTLLAEQDDFLHSMLHFNLGLHDVMLGETQRAVNAFTDTLRLSQSVHNPLVSIIAQTQMGEVYQIRGALRLAERTFQQSIQYTKDTLGAHTFLLGMPYISYAELLREQNRFEEAISYAEQGITYCQVWQPVASMDGQITLARIKAAQGHWKEAFNRLERALRVAEGSVSVLDDIFVHIQLVRLALLRGDLAHATHWINLYDLEKNSQGAYYHLWEMVQLALMRAKLMELETDPAPAANLAKTLTSLIAGAERRERVTPIIESLILQSYAFHAAALPVDAAQSLSRAVTLGAQCDYVRIFADEGQRLLRLLDQYNSQIHAPHTYMNNILEILRRETSQPAPTSGRGQFVLDGLSPLTRRELDILSLMASGKSNQEIAAECVLSLNTVKKHVANILSKMGVANRTQAVMLARKLGWIA